MGILGVPGRVQRALGLSLHTASGDAGVGEGPQVCVLGGEVRVAARVQRGP